MYPSEIRKSAFLLVSIVAVISCITASTVDVALVQFHLWGDKTPTSVQFVGPVRAKAVEDLAPYKDVLNITTVFVYERNVTTCDAMDERVTYWFASYYYRFRMGNPIMGVFGPGCPTAAASVAQLAGRWNYQMLATSWGDRENDLSNKRRYPTLTSLSPFNHYDLSMMVHKILAEFRYNNVAMLCDDASDSLGLYASVCSFVFDIILLKYNVRISRYYVNATDENNVKRYLDEMKTIARVAIIIAHGDRIRPIMLAASDKKMTEGDYVYFTIELFQSAKFFGNITWNTGESDGRDSDARTAFSSLFKISLRNPDATPEYRNVTDEIKRRSENIFGYTFALEEEVNPFAMANYYALVIFAQVVNQTIALGGNPLDGGALSRRMWNRTYTILGQDIILNANGDREADWSLNQMDVETGKFVPVMEYSAKRKALEPSRDPVDNSNRKIVWYKRDSPPPNEPKCGYRGINPDCRAKEQGSQYRKFAAAAPNLLEV